MYKIVFFLLAFTSYASSLVAATANSVVAKQTAIENGILPRDPQRPHGPETIQQRMRDLAVPGVSIAVINNGKIDWSQGYGELDSPKWRIQAASISKTITALTVLSLIEMDKSIGLDTDVSQILGCELWSKIDPEGRTVTIGHLLAHTAGINVSSFQGYRRDQQPLPTTDDILLGKGNSAPVRVVSQPGTKFAYSGGGMTILQKVIELLALKPFSEVVAERVFARLGMECSTYYPKAEEAIHGNGPDGRPIPGYWRLYPEQAASGLWTTPEDLAKVLIAIQESLRGDKEAFLSQLLAQEMVTPQTEGKPNGLGIFVNKLPDSLVYSYTGANAGFRCIMIANEHGQGAVIMTNSDHGVALQDELLIAIAKAYNWPNAELLPHCQPLFDFNEIGPVDRDAFGAKFAGTYLYRDHVVTLSHLEGKSTLQVDSDPAFEIVPFGDKIAYFRIFNPGPYDVVRFTESQDGSTILIFCGAEHTKVSL